MSVIKGNFQITEKDKDQIKINNVILYIIRSGNTGSPYQQISFNILWKTTEPSIGVDNTEPSSGIIDMVLIGRRKTELRNVTIRLKNCK